MRRTVVVAGIAGIAACHGGGAASSEQSGPDGPVVDGPASDAPGIDAPDEVHPVPGPSDGARSGTRLKLTMFQADDGFSILRPLYYDTQNQFECVEMRWDDGVSYCTPPRNLDLTWQQSTVPVTRVSYADDRCTQAIAPSDTAADGFAMELDPITGVVLHLYRRGATLGKKPSFVKVDDLRTGCNPDGSGTVYAVIEVPASSLVAMHRYIGPVGADGFAISYLGTEDGFQVPLGMYARVLDEICEMRGKQRVSTTVACSPFAYAADAYLDAECKVGGVLSVPMISGRMPTILASGGARPSTVFKRGAQLTSAFKRGGWGCEPVDPRSSLFYSFGAEITLPTLTRTRGSVPGRRFQYVYDTADSGLAVREPMMFYDGANDVVWSIHDSVFQPREVACGRIWVVFHDPRCTSVADAYYEPDPWCDGPIPAHLAGYPITSKPYRGGDYYEIQGVGYGSCQRSQPSPSALSVGPPVAAVPLGLRMVIDR